MEVMTRPASVAPVNQELKERSKGVVEVHAVRPIVSHQLMPTTLLGAFISPPLPQGFDFNQADRRALFQHGAYWRKPKAGDPPALIEAWQQHLGKSWPADKRIVPQFDVRYGK